MKNSPFEPREVVMQARLDYLFEDLMIGLLTLFGFALLACLPTAIRASRPPKKHPALLGLKH